MPNVPPKISFCTLFVCGEFSNGFSGEKECGTFASAELAIEAAELWSNTPVTWERSYVLEWEPVKRNGRYVTKWEEGCCQSQKVVATKPTQFSIAWQRFD